MQVINAFEQCFFQSLTLLSETLLSLKLPLLAACPYQIIITIFHISQKYLHSWFSLSNFEKNWSRLSLFNVKFQKTLFKVILGNKYSRVGQHFHYSEIHYISYLTWYSKHSNCVASSYVYLSTWILYFSCLLQEPILIESPFSKRNVYA